MATSHLLLPLRAAAPRPPRPLFSPLTANLPPRTTHNCIIPPLLPHFTLLSGPRDNLPSPLRFEGRRGRGAEFTCCYGGKEKAQPAGSSSSNDDDDESLKEEWPIFRRWDVPWGWQTGSLIMVACAVSFVLTGLVEQALLPYIGFDIAEASLDQKAEVLLFGQLGLTVAILGVIFGITNTFKPYSDDIFRYDVKEPFKLQNGWLLWAAIGLVGAFVAVALVGYVTALLNGETPQREDDALSKLLPLIGSSGTSTACLVILTGVLAPVLEETIFRGFLLATLTKWVPTPVAVVISAATFSLAHLTPSEFPQLFVLGAALGLTYAQTRNLLAPITIHAFWNSGVILLLTFLQLQGYDIKELLQAN